MLAKKLNAVVFGLALLLPGAALGAGKSDKAPSAEAKFIKDAAEGGMMEVELGKLASSKASSNQVKEFGRRMEQDHGKANKELEQVAAKKNIDLPKQLEGKHKSEVDRLSKLSGEKFDREYMQAMIKDHKADVDKFQREADKGKDPDIKQFASKTLPTLKQHLELARTAGQQVGALSRR